MIAFESNIDNLLSCIEGLETAEPIKLPEEQVNEMLEELERRSELMFDFIKLHRKYMKTCTIQRKSTYGPFVFSMLGKRWELSDELIKIRTLLSDINIETEPMWRSM